VLYDRDTILAFAHIRDVDIVLNDRGAGNDEVKIFLLEIIKCAGYLIRASYVVFVKRQWNERMVNGRSRVLLLRRGEQAVFL
jgi:hypothetical protein